MTGEWTADLAREVRTKPEESDRSAGAFDTRRRTAVFDNLSESPWDMPFSGTVLCCVSDRGRNDRLEPISEELFWMDKGAESRCGGQNG